MKERADKRLPWCLRAIRTRLQEVANHSATHLFLPFPWDIKTDQVVAIKSRWYFRNANTACRTLIKRSEDKSVSKAFFYELDENKIRNEKSNPITSAARNRIPFPAYLIFPKLSLSELQNKNLFFTKMIFFQEGNRNWKCSNNYFKWIIESKTLSEDATLTSISIGNGYQV